MKNLAALIHRHAPAFWHVLALSAPILLHNADHD
jgi:hypothetical protein